MLTESMEDYLEMIFRLQRDKGYVRAVDLSEALQIQAPSVTKMIQKLDEAGFIDYQKYRNIGLTSEGEKYGAFLVWRDATLKGFLSLLKDMAGIDAQVEGIEHYITPITMELIYKLIQFFQEHPDSLEELHNLPSSSMATHVQALDRLRAWEFRHNWDD